MMRADAHGATRTQRPLTKGLPGLLTGFAVAVGFAMFVGLSRWGGRPDLFLARSSFLVLLVALALSAVVGVVCGQTRWRMATAQRRRLDERTFREQVVFYLPVLIGPAAVSVLLILVTVGFVGLGSLYDGVLAADILRQLTTLPGVLLVYVVACGASTWVGLQVGIRSRCPLTAPLMFGLTTVVALVVSWSLAVVLPAEAPGLIRYRAVEEPLNGINAEDITCVGAGPTVCTSGENAGYMDAAHRTLVDIYHDAPLAGELPPTVYLVDSTAARERYPGRLPAVGLSGQRGVIAPERLDQDSVTEDLLQSIRFACISGSSVTTLPVGDLEFAVNPGHEPEASSDEVVTQLTEARECFDRASWPPGP